MYKNGAIFCPTLYVQCSRKFITTSERLKSFEVDFVDMPLSSQVESSRMCSSRPPSIWGHFSLKSGQVSVPQQLPGLVTDCDTQLTRVSSMNGDCAVGVAFSQH